METVPGIGAEVLGRTDAKGSVALRILGAALFGAPFIIAVILLYSRQAASVPGYAALGLVWRDIAGAATPFVISALIGATIARKCATTSLGVLIACASVTGAVWGIASWALWFAVVNSYETTVLSNVKFQKSPLVPSAVVALGFAFGVIALFNVTVLRLVARLIARARARSRDG